MEEKGREHVCLPALRVPFFVAWDEAQHADGMDGSQRFLTTDPSSGFVRQARAFCIPSSPKHFSHKFLYVSVLEENLELLLVATF
jgi:hypothetical protein